MKKLLLIPFLFSIIYSSAQSFDFNNSLDGWSSVQGAVTATTGAEAVTLDYAIPSGATNFSPKFVTTTANIDGTVSNILAITINTGASDVGVIKIKHDRLATSGDRFVSFDVAPNNNQFVTYYFNLDDNEWNNTNTSPAIQNNIEILFRGVGDVPVAYDSSVQIDKIEFSQPVPRLIYTFADPNGFIPRNTASFSTSNGIGNVTLTGTNNSANLLQNVFSVDSDVNKVLQLRVKNNTANNQLRFAFANTTGSGSPRNFTAQPMTPNSTDFEIITFNLTGNASWTAESIVDDFDFRFRNTANGNTAEAGLIEIDYVIFSELNITTYVYENGTWTPNDPAGVSTFAENIVIDDTVTLTSGVQCNDITVLSNGALSLGTGNTLNFKGSLVNDGSIDGTGGTLRISGPATQSVTGATITAGDMFIINSGGGVTMNANVDLQGRLTLSEGVLDVTNSTFTFKSTATNSAIIAPVVNGSINGAVTVEQFYPANRAFRFVSSPVDMEGTIFDNWQQGGLNPGDATYQAGVGTHITGGSATDGFDQSVSNAPSLFGFNNAYTDINNSWTTFTAPTNTTSLNAGEPYRLFIRGDRSVSLTTAGAAATDTKLVTRGTIVTGAQSIMLTAVDGNFVYVGNPYQAQVDLNTVLTNSEDVNPNTYYAWNPTMNNYVAYSFALGGTQSSVNQFIQPGQSYFVLIADDGDANSPSINYTESDKSTATATSATYSLPQAYLTMTVQNDLNTTKDRITLLFNDQGTTSITDLDAPKFKGTDEQLMISTNGNQLSIDDRLTPVDQEIIQLNMENFITGNYQFTVNASGFTIPVYVEDQFTGQFTLLDTSNPTIIPFSVDSNNSASADLDRFRIRFSNSTLGLNDSAFAKAISLYPNPSNDDTVTIENLEGETTLQIINLLGQTMITENTTSNRLDVNIAGLKQGTYLVNIANDSGSQTLKLIKK